MENNLVSLEMTLHWQDEHARHTSKQYFAKANLWRDILPIAMTNAFSKPEVGSEVICDIPAGDLFEPYDESQVVQIQQSQFNTNPRPGIHLLPKVGRFYPRNIIKNHASITSDDNRPMRILSMLNEVMKIDLNLPLSSYDVSVSARVDELLPPAQEHGGRCNDFVYDMLKSGVGMQTALNNIDTDFFSGNPFSRLDELDDSIFYKKPRLVHHLDKQARKHLESIYESHLEPGMRVLDLMSSWVSHIPKIDNIDVTGVGMNEEELKQNKALNHYIIQDLNQSPTLQLDKQAFNLAVCTASIEYLVNPIKVMTEVARCLKPGALFAITFSDRWFPPKAIQLWSELHSFEKIAFVAECFKQSGKYKDIETLSIQHYPRPIDDKYSNQLAYSDPIFAVWAKVR